MLDVEGAYANWLDDIGADFVILRPDFHVAATTADPVRLRSHLETILNELHLTADGRATATAE
ncbi:hypothetical protein [Halopolyspora algeriensis]|uniref:hypothetical protein n=1 Tax=Halopolyspora algeriensis TaxID=1500506 RepID=UPI0011519F74|nr:hypothetical protein [Halopolyspora algeriensis]